MKHLLPAAEVEQAISALAGAFYGMQRHDLWDARGELICSPSKVERLLAIQKLGLEGLGLSDLDFLMSCAALTIGTDETVRYLTPRYLSALLSFPQFGWYTAGAMMRDRLDRCGFDGWSKAQRVATAEALILMGRALVLMSDESCEEPEIDGGELIAWATAKRNQANAELVNGRRKAPKKMGRKGVGELRR
jgi:hypothetical protein